MSESKQKLPNLFFNEEESQQKKDMPQKKGIVQPVQHTISLSTGKLQIVNPKNSLANAPDSRINAEKLPKKESRGENEHKSDKSVSSGRTHTGIPGMDDIMEGGFKKNSVNLIGGGAGSGKSIFCMQFLVEGARKHNENGLYISFEESEDKIIEDFKKFNWELRDLIEKKKIIILYYSPDQIQKVLQTGGGVIRDILESANAKRLVIDSITAFTLLFEKDIEKRRAVLKLMESEGKWGVTTLVTSEHEPDIEKHRSNVVEFEVDGVILLYNTKKGDIRERSMEILKMRGTKHASKIFPMKIDESGIVIYPEETVF